MNYADLLAARLPRATEIIRSQRIITAAILRRKNNMALADKATHLADRVLSIPKTIENVFDAQLDRLNAIEQRGTKAAIRLTSIVDDVDSAVTSTENVLNQLNNGGPA